jgi:hypothetical protein
MIKKKPKKKNQKKKTYIKTPQQHKLFKDFQRLAYTKLLSSASADDRKILKPVKLVVTR